MNADEQIYQDVLDAIRTIICHGYEFEAIGILLKEIESDYDKFFSNANRFEKQLNAIKKLNQGKNEAIDAMCETEED